ncbi:MAG: putative metallopeptidase [Aigarchaeota archaeon]|nr:putative metallopeptidase [Aigarchaeota archaeon]MDW8092313.1 putative metallopeptidase [Nitrososphaerota archaeon]
MRYVRARDLEERTKRMVDALGLNHIDPERVICIRSYGSRSKRTLARVHAPSKAVLAALNMKPVYVIEFIEEACRRLTDEQLEDVILHELLHIPKSFSGGLRGHDARFSSELESYRKFLSRARRYR